MTYHRKRKGLRAFRSVAILSGLALLAGSPTFASFETFASFDPRAAAPQRANALGELVDRTLAIIGNQVITLSDVRTALDLGLVAPSKGADPVIAATERLVDRLLVLREVQRYAPPEPSDVNVEEQLAAVRRRFATEALQIGRASCRERV